MDIIRWIDDNKKQFTDLSNQIWDFAELSLYEHKSAEAIKQVLKENDFKVQETVGYFDTAFIGTYGEGKPVIGILAEYDALDGQSQVADLAEKKSREGTNTGHGCGHNILGGGSVATAVAIKEYLKATGTKGTIKLVGCPAEENDSGKAFLAREGVFDDIDTAICWHPWTFNGVWSTPTLANTQVYFKFKGISAHAAASPHLGRSALDGVELMNVGVNYLREHIIQEARVHYAVTNPGGSSPNVVQEEAEVLYLIRAPKADDVRDIYERVCNIARGAALMTGTQVETEMRKGCSNITPNNVLAEVMNDVSMKLEPMTFNDEENEYAKSFIETLREEEKKSTLGMIRMFGLDMSEEVKTELTKPLLEKFIPYVECNRVMAGSSDVGDVSWITPTIQCVATCYAQSTTPHSWQMVSQGKSSIAHKGLVHGAKMMAKTAQHLFENTDIIEKAKEELKERLDGKQYICPIPEDVIPRACRKEK